MPPQTLETSTTLESSGKLTRGEGPYFVIPSLDHLLQVTVETDFAPVYGELEHLPDIDIAEIAPGDEVITRGSQEYARRST
jgi:phenylalanine-4-hydroxylase